LEFSPLVYVALIAVAFFAGFISSIAGSGGLIVLPVLLAAGIPPLTALATNKFQSVFGTLSSTINFLRHGHLDLAALKGALICAFSGALLGTWLVQRVSSDLLSQGLPYILLALAAYVMFMPDPSGFQKKQGENQPWHRRKFAIWAGGGIGLYGGFLGPGVGSFFTLALVALRGLSLTQATAASKPLVLVTNSTSTVLFVYAGLVFWPLALSMAIAQFVGARLGSNLVISRGAAFIKPVLIGVLVCLSLKLLLFPSPSA